jgi:murein DD-endopeptidase MepM/ murein hydrolase activator NlpD
MAGSARRTGRTLAGLFPERHLYLQSATHTRYVRLTPFVQLVLGVAALGATGWMAVASATVVLNLVYADAHDSRADVLHEAYRARLTELAEERDQRAAEAYSAQNRFQIAMEQLGRQQSHLLEAVEENRELATALGVTRDRITAAVEERDAVRAEAEALRVRVSKTSESLAEKTGRRADLSATLEAVSGALTETARVRDRAEAERAALSQRVAGLELEIALAERRQDEVFAELEQAIELSFTPLAQMFAAADLDVDSLMAKVRNTYSGQGGPLVPVGVSSRSYDGGLSSRLDELMIGLDRVNLLRIAADGVPFARPVSGGAYRFTSGFGYRRDPKGGGQRMHLGIDLAAAQGTPIYATASGVVVKAGREGGYGNVVRIRHAFGFETVYAHQHTLRVKPGQQVSRGDHIGDMGTTGRSTGVHLHYEVHLNGAPVNPMSYLEAAKDVF